MKNILLHTLLGLFVFTSTPLAQLSKLPVLIAHYTEHQNENKQLSFIDFVKLHYNNTNCGQEDKHHEQLPFKKITPLANCTIVAPHSVAFEQKFTYTPQTLKVTFRYLNFVPDNAIRILIQPPKIY
ncbi:MAG: hypothetical protein H7331_03225 [Bacteroidia bacterium]|nr:hypothetical protein [Bacteroidia bacterium]